MFYIILFFIIIVIFLYYLFRDTKRNINYILQNHYYINLEHRIDRKISTINELKKIGIKEPNRFNAIKNDNGLIGCCMSHLEVLKLAKKNDWDYITVFEDDVEFLKPEETLKKINNIFNSKIKWDVIILGGNNSQPYKQINNDCIQVFNCQTTTSYIVKKEYYDKLIDHWTEGLNNLIITNDSPKYALDITWKQLQNIDTFLLVIPINVVQRESYSDIENRNVNYKNVMLNLY